VDVGEGYELIDAGDGRRLERFGAVVVDRPAPTADEARRDPAVWSAADLAFARYVGWESLSAEPPQPWRVREGRLTYELRPTDTGQVGLFPEQAANRAWATDVIHALRHPVSVLNLFAYTGAMTLAIAAAGADVTHVDASRPSVAWARRNAELSGLADRPVRWIVDDVDAFVAREVRRGRTYDAVVLDPPSYGHGRAGRSWRLDERLPALLDACATLTGPRPAFVILTAHTPGFGPGELADALLSAFDPGREDVEAGELALHARSGARLRLGAFARMIGR
jgi:23S rRNA (cytosine1962-C5)-methyltransferase